MLVTSPHSHHWSLVISHAGKSWTSLLPGAHPQQWWVAVFQIPGFPFKILYLPRFMFFLLNFPPWAANNLSQRPCVYSVTFLILPASALSHSFTVSSAAWAKVTTLGCVRAVPLIAECRIPQRGSHTSSHHSSCWSVWPFLGPAHGELWRFSWAGVGLLEDLC